MALNVRSSIRTSLLLRRCMFRTPLVTRLAPASSAREEMKTYWELNMDRKRPVSPYLSSYSLGLTGNMSLTHRITGIMLYSGLSVFGIGMLALPGNFPEYLAMIKDLQLGGVIIFSSKALLCFPLVYHFLNGIRHLAWDTGRGFDLKTTYNGGYLVMGLVAVVTIALASISVSP